MTNHLDDVARIRKSVERIIICVVSECLMKGQNPLYEILHPLKAAGEGTPYT